MTIIAILFCSTVSAQSDQAVFEEFTVSCVAPLALASRLTDVKLSKMTFSRSAKWWRALLAVSVDKEEADSRVVAEMMRINTMLKNEEISWDELMDIVDACNEAELSLRTASE